MTATALWPRLAVLDLDGTVLDSQRQLAREVEAEIRRIRSAGIRVVLATGRPYLATAPLAHHIGLELPVILENGALVVDLRTGRRLEYRPMDREALGRLLDVIEPLEHFFITVSGDDELLLEGDPAYLARAVFSDEVPESARFVKTFPELRLQASTKLWLCAPGPSIDRLIAETAGDGRLGHARTMEDSIDYTAAGVSKLAALRDLLAGWDIRLSEVVAIGDSMNDLELLASVGLGVAMGNSPDAIKEVAAMVTDDNDHAGVAAALRRAFPPKRGTS